MNRYEARRSGDFFAFYMDVEGVEYGVIIFIQYSKSDNMKHIKMDKIRSTIFMSFFQDMDASKFTAVENIIYGYMVENIDLIPYMRVRDIAQNTHTSSTSVFRFIKKIGYESFSEFRYDFKEKIMNENYQHESGASFIEDKLSQITRENFDFKLEEKIRQLSISIQNVDRVIIFGIGSSGIVGEYAARRLTNVGIDAIHISDPTYNISSFFSVNSNYLVIVLSVSGNTKETIEVMTTFGNRYNTELWAITGDLSGKIVQLSDFSINYSTKFNRKNVYSDMTSQIPAMFIIESFVNEVDNLGT